MSVKINIHQKTRPYKIDVFGLQDNFIATLQAYEDSFLGQVIEPRMEIKDDGTQTFSCKIPKFYLSEKPNERIINPRWQDAENGILAENTRVLKVTVQFSETEKKTFPFIIDKIVNKREKDFSTYKEITGNGLAFAELGKIGYKLELNSTVLEQDFIKDDTTVATIDYWLDKIFPNEKDEDGIITKWLTPWSYEIRMDWRGYFEELSDTFIDGGTSGQIEGYNFYNSRNAEWINRDKNWLLINAGTSGPLYQNRDETKIYENPHVADWQILNGKLQPVAIESFIEKARYIDCANSNKYNITQTLAETFEVFCTYEYNCDSNGYFKKTYWDEYGNVWTGKKVIFFNRAIKTEKPYVLNYQRNLQTISRIIDSSEVYTKMYVNPVASETMDTGYISIADTPYNPLLDDFILNFDYMHQIGSINDLQKAEVENYKVKIHKLNKQLIQLEEEYGELIVKLNNAEAAKAKSEASLASTREQLVNYETLRDNEVTNTPVIRSKTNPYSLVMVPQSNFDTVQGTFKLNGINAATLRGWRNNKYGVDDGELTGKFLFSESSSKESERLIIAQTPPSTSDTFTDRWYLTLDEYGFPATLFTSKKNRIFNEDKDKYFGSKFEINTGAIIYLDLEYCPKNKYEAVCEKFNSLIDIELAKIADYNNIIGKDESENIEEWTGLKKEIKENELAREALYNKKNALNFRFERILGPALREGYWQPDSYEDPGEGHNESLSYLESSKNNTHYIFDEIPFDGEQLNYYYNDPTNITEKGKIYYPYIDLSSIYQNIGTNGNALTSFCISLTHPEYVWILQKNTTINANTKYFFQLNSKFYEYTINGTYTTDDTTNPKKIYILTIHTKDLSSSQKAPYISIKQADNFEGNNAVTLVQYIATKEVSSPPKDGYNTTVSFMGTNQYLSSRNLYNNAGFVFCYLKTGENIYKPIALLTSEDIDYTRYNIIEYSFNDNTTIESDANLTISKNTKKYPIVYPRLFLDYRNVNHESESLQLFVTTNNDTKKLIKFEDYSILLRKGRPYVILKITNNNLPWYILNEQYNIIYQVSRANEQLYLDAKRVAKDSSKPKYSYEVTIANLPQEMSSLELGQLVHVNDYNVDIYKEYGYVSELSYQLDKPSQDRVVIANYKTKFEDLFSSISAQNEAMKQNVMAYNIAASSFTSSGEVEQDVLQTTLDNNDFAFNFSNTNVTLDNTGGLILTNTSQYVNGVYGQVALRGGGIFCSNSVDANGNRIWTTGITPDGINASLVTTGRLDTNLIRIYAGDTLAFQWSNEGLFAYKETTLEGKPTLDDTNYIRLNEEGLIYVSEGETQLNLGWEGLRIEGADGHVKLTSANGLQMFGENEEKPLVTFGKYGNSYGMFFTDINGNIQLQATHNGNLQLIDTLTIGDKTQNNNYTGLCGKDKYIDSTVNSYVRFWAGSNTPQSAPVTITENGTIKAKTIVIPEGGSIQFKKGNSTITLTYDDLVTLGIN